MLPWFWCVTSFAIILHVVLVYPLVLRFVAKRRAKPIVKSGGLRSVSVLVAVHNGALFIREKILSILAQNYPRHLMQIIVVSDGSTDETEQIVKEFAQQRVRLISTHHNGKPAALNIGVPDATGEILVLTDVRQVLEPQCIRELVACFGDESVGVVSGELLIGSGATQGEVNIGLYWKFESWMRKQLASVDSMFGATGPIYAVRRNLVVELPPDILLDDVYLPLTAFFRGYRLVVEERARVFDHPAKLASEFRRKVRTLAGNYQVLKYLPQLLGPSNRMWFHFVSYKLGRLLLPYALATMAVSSLFLKGPIGHVVASSQVAFYLLAALDFCVPQSPLKKISSPAGTFIAMMIAAVCALLIFFVPARSLWTQSTIQPVKREESGKDNVQTGNLLQGV